MPLGFDPLHSLNCAWDEADYCKQMNEWPEMEQGGRGKQLVGCMGCKDCRCMQSKCWVNHNFSRINGKARESDWKSNWAELRCSTTTPLRQI